MRITIEKSTNGYIVYSDYPEEDVIETYSYESAISMRVGISDLLGRIYEKADQPEQPRLAGLGERSSGPEYINI